MSKFVGKFRKNQDYSDDHSSMKFLGSKNKKRNEHGEIRKLISKDCNETLDYDEFDEDYKKVK